jgi:transcriptional antiterminator
LSNNQNIERKLDSIDKKLELLIVIMLINAGMKLPDIAQTLGVSVRTIQNRLPVAKLKYAKGKRGQPETEENTETTSNAEPPSTTPQA